MTKIHFFKLHLYTYYFIFNKRSDIIITTRLITIIIIVVITIIIIIVIITTASGVYLRRFCRTDKGTSRHFRARWRNRHTRAESRICRPTFPGPEALSSSALSPRESWACRWPRAPRSPQLERVRLRLSRRSWPCRAAWRSSWRPDARLRHRSTRTAASRLRALQNKLDPGGENLGPTQFNQRPRSSLIYFI